MIRMIQTNVTATIIEEFFIIKKIPTFDIFLEIVYTTFLKLLAKIFIIV